MGFQFNSEKKLRGCRIGVNANSWREKWIVNEGFQHGRFEPVKIISKDLFVISG